MPASIQNPIPEWLRPGGESVLDPTYVTVLRKLAHLFGADDPTSQVAATMTPMQTGANGGVMAALQRLAQRLNPTLADRIQPVGQGRYAFTDPAKYRMERLHETGAGLPNAANWDGVTEELLSAFGGDRAMAERWSRLVGATSPNTSVPVNTRESVSALAHSLENPGVPMTVPMAQQLEPAKITMAPSKVPNINHAIAGEPLSGDKVEAFSQLMVGRPRIPMDVHALNAAGSTLEKFDDELPALRKMMTEAEGLPIRNTKAKPGLSNSDIYMRAERAMADALDEIAPDMPTNRSFATMWEGTRDYKGLKPQGGPIDILRRKGLLKEGAMLDPGRLRAALKTAGWTAPAIAAVMQAMSNTSPETMPLEPE